MTPEDMEAVPWRRWEMPARGDILATAGDQNSGRKL
jgi:hypothetical protein